LKGYLMPQVETTTPDPVQNTPAPVTDDNGNDITAEQEREQTTTGADQPSEDASQTSDADDNAPDEGGEESTPDGDQPEGDETTTDDAGNADEDSEYRDWAAKKNLPLDDPEKLGKMLYNAERELGKKGQEAGELKKAVSAANNEAGIDDVQSLRNEVEALNFKLAHPEAVSLEPLMVEILDERPYLANDLEAVLLMAKGRTAPSEAEIAAQARKAGGKEALDAAARAERAKPPRAAATTREEPSPYMSDAEVGALSPADYAKAKAEGKIRPW
jgi:hypothetical protein